MHLIFVFKKSINTGFLVIGYKVVSDGTYWISRLVYPDNNFDLVFLDGYSHCATNPEGAC